MSIPIPPSRSGARWIPPALLIIVAASGIYYAILKAEPPTKHDGLRPQRDQVAQAARSFLEPPRYQARPAQPEPGRPMPQARIPVRPAEDVLPYAVEHLEADLHARVAAGKHSPEAARQVMQGLTHCLAQAGVVPPEQQFRCLLAGHELRQTFPQDLDGDFQRMLGAADPYVKGRFHLAVAPP